MPLAPSLFWFRQDLRISDNPALLEAANNGPLLAIYIFDQEKSGDFKMGAASRWWLHHSLTSLNQSLQGKLNFYQGNAQQIIASLLQEHQIKSVYWNCCYEPWHLQEEKELKKILESSKISYKTFHASLLWEPSEVLKTDKTPYKVFTPFYRQATSLPIRQPAPAPKNLILLQDSKNKTTLQNLKLLPTIAWDNGWLDRWKIGEEAAQEKLVHFLKHSLSGYQEKRDEPGKRNTSRLSPHLHFGEISPHQIWHTTREHALNALKRDGDYFLRELVWREFSHSLLFHFPTLPYKNFQKIFDHFAWKADSHLLQAWQKGMTGYPIVDAGMRELWQTGTMHNRVRMITASFLVKNLLIHWKHGAAWFWDCLVDADLANNSASWQWVAGSGADAAPYFRIFNPVLQGEKFDKEGIYTRRFVPELAKLPNRFLFKPWQAPDTLLKASGITLGKNYPHPIVDLQASRDKALEAYQLLKTL